MRVEAGSVVYGVEIRFDHRGQLWRGTNRKLEAYGVRYCSRCQCVLAVNRFNRGQIICKECWRVDPFRVKNSRRSASKLLARRWHNKQKAIDMLGGKCVRCELAGAHPITYHFHHVSRAQKKFNISNAIGRIGFFENKQCMDELKKCALLCDSCHQTLNLEWQASFRRRRSGIGYELTTKGDGHEGYRGRNIQPALGCD